MTVFCRSCGEVNADVTQQLFAAEREVAELRTQLDGAEEAIRLLDKEARARRSQLARLQAQVTESKAPELGDAMEVAQYWKELLAPRTRQLRGPRIEKTIARLRSTKDDEGYSVEELKRAIWGYQCRQYVVDGKRSRQGKRNERHVDLELIMRDAKHVDAGIAIADEEQHSDQGLLNEGTSRYVARLCDCGHARGSHALTWKQGHDACMEKDCRCEAFDDLNRRSDEWLRDQGYFDKPSTPGRSRTPIREQTPVKVRTPVNGAHASNGATQLHLGNT